MDTRITADNLRSLLNYDPETGIFTWKNQRSTRPAGSIAGYAKYSKARTRYWYIKISQRLYLAHRLAWLYMTGNWPPAEIDHVDCDGLNNRWQNLRSATRTQNLMNRYRSKHNKSGAKGVSFDKRSGKYHAKIKFDGRLIYLGQFNSLEEAASAYGRAANEYYGEFARMDLLNLSTGAAP